MKSDEPSMTARLCAASRGAHLRLDAAPHVLEDTYADALSGFTPDQLAACSVDQLEQFQSAGTRATMSVRSRLVEDAVAEMAALGPLQYVIFGAGLDAFALRKPDSLAHVRVFEVDHIATQAWKTQRLEQMDCKVPESLSLVDVDFETERFEDKLCAKGLQRQMPTLFSLLGVSQYISRSALQDLAKRTVDLINERCALIMNFIPPVETLPEAGAKAVRSIVAKSAEGGEPFVSYYDVGELRALLGAAGFQAVQHIGPEDLAGMYFSCRKDGLRSGQVLNMMRATVGGVEPHPT